MHFVLAQPFVHLTTFLSIWPSPPGVPEPRILAHANNYSDLTWTTCQNFEIGMRTANAISLRNKVSLLDKMYHRRYHSTELQIAISLIR